MLEAELLRESEPAAHAVGEGYTSVSTTEDVAVTCRVERTEQSFHPTVVRYVALPAIVHNKRCQVESLAPQCEWCASGRYRCHECLWVRALKPTLVHTA